MTGAQRDELPPDFNQGDDSFVSIYYFYLYRMVQEIQVSLK